MIKNVNSSKHFLKIFSRISIFRHASVLLVIVIISGLAFLWPVAAGPFTSPRKLTLVTRDMAFYLDGLNIPNPVLTMHPGETVHVMLRNEDVGFKHNFEVPAWNQAIQTPKKNSFESILIEVPGLPGRYEYICGPHSALMHGFIEVIND